MRNRSNLLAAITGLIYAVYAIYIIRTFETFTVHCYDPYPSYSLFTFAVIICFILPKAFIMCVAATIVVLCSPCICYFFYQKN